MELFTPKRLSLGTAQVGLDYGFTNKTGRMGDSELISLVSLAREKSVKHLDTAFAYGNAQSRLAAVGVSDFCITTKIASSDLFALNEQDDLFQLVKRQRDNFSITAFENILFHDEASLLGENAEENYRLMRKLKGEGLTRKIGVSVYSPKSLDELLESFRPDTVQIPLNVFDRRFLSAGAIQKMVSLGIEIQARSTFLQGVLLGDGHDLPVKDLGDRRAARDWFAWNQDLGLNPLQSALGFVLGHEEISNVLVGVESTAQLLEIIDASERVPSETFPNFDVTEQLIDPRTWAKE
jgi:aryl-alcohol dehydrogenase-like predicted oxidoreductase